MPKLEVMTKDKCYNYDTRLAVKREYERLRNLVDNRHAFDLTYFETERIKMKMQQIRDYLD